MAGSGASWGAAPVPTSHPSVYWMASNSGLLTRIDLKERRVTAVLQVSTACSTPTAVLVRHGKGRSALVIANLHGDVDGVVGLEAVNTT